MRNVSPQASNGVNRAAANYGGSLPDRAKVMLATSVGVFVGGNPEHLIKRAVANDCRDNGNQADKADKVLENNAIQQHGHAQDSTNGSIFLPHIFLHGCSVKS